eukprot:scaffold5418_cov107-Cylindrotheca_fusiformis.AAC.3
MMSPNSLVLVTFLSIAFTSAFFSKPLCNNNTEGEHHISPLRQDEKANSPKSSHHTMVLHGQNQFNSSQVGTTTTYRHSFITFVQAGNGGA